MNLVKSRLFRLFQRANTVEDLARQVEDLRAVLFSALQEIAVLKAMLRENGAWDDGQYGRLRTQQMIADHSSAGADPWIGHSYYPYLLTDEEFLRHRLSADDAEVAAFRRKVEAVQQAT